MLDQSQQCPCCEGAIPREDFAREELIGYIVTYLYCTFCGRGWETLWQMVNGLEFPPVFVGRVEPPMQ